MARDLVVFPLSKAASATAYLEFCNANSPDTTPGAIWDVPDKVDRHGQRVVGYLGPSGFDWNSTPFPEPEGGVIARADGVLSSTVEWPEEE